MVRRDRGHENFLRLVPRRRFRLQLSNLVETKNVRRYRYSLTYVRPRRVTRFRISRQRFLRFYMFVGEGFDLRYHDGAGRVIWQYRSNGSFLLPIMFVFRPTVVHRGVRRFTNVPNLLRNLYSLLSYQNNRFFLRYSWWVTSELGVFRVRGQLDFSKGITSRHQCENRKTIAIERGFLPRGNISNN